MEDLTVLQRWQGEFEGTLEGDLQLLESTRQFIARTSSGVLVLPFSATAITEEHILKVCALPLIAEGTHSWWTQRQRLCGFGGAGLDWKLLASVRLRHGGRRGCGSVAPGSLPLYFASARGR